MTHYHVVSGSTQGLRDTDVFIEFLTDRLQNPGAECSELFDAHKDVIVTRAPGRLDLMGGIGDYSGSLVLELPLQAAVHVAIQRNESRRLKIVSLGDEPQIGTRDTCLPQRVFEMSLEELASISDYDKARERFANDREGTWAAYVAGNFIVLMHERGASFDDGASMLIHSAVPEGKGVSSSAALEVASMQAIATAYEIQLKPLELALLCQRVENLIVGAPCGVMDQMTATCGEADSLLELLCQPADLKGTLNIPDELEVWGIDSGIRHWVGGSDYRTVRTAAFMGYRVIAEIAGLKVGKCEQDGKVIIDDPEWKGYLANITPEQFERDYAAGVPEEISGEDFLKLYQGISDKVTAVEPGTSYPVRVATSYPVYENSRVKRFAEIVRSGRAAEQASRLGEMMFESHENYSRCGLGSDGTDELVALIKAARESGLYGAKITGGGSGGTVAVLGQRGSGARVREIARQYQDATGHQPAILSGSSPGAAAFGYLKLKLN